MTLEQKQVFWQKHIDGWQHSQLSRKAYCKQHSLSFSSFGYWRTRLRRKPVSEKKLIQVAVQRPAASVTIVLSAGIRMEVPVHALSDVLPVIYRTQQVCA